jgi:hypothetical protein
MLKSVLTIAVVFMASLVSCHSGTETPSKISDARSLLGNWKLRTVGGKAPATINIKSWQVDFQIKGKWNYSGEMTGLFDGMKLSGSGTWLVQGDQLEYTAGDSKGKTTVHLDGDSLLLSPDPVIMVKGKQPVETGYVKLRSQ